MVETSEPIRFGIVGAGARAAHYLRIAAAAPERFQVSGVVARSDERGSGVRQRFRVSTHGSLDDLLSRESQQFVVVAVRPAGGPAILRELVAAGVPALAETPAAWDLDDLDDLCELERTGARLQVAEQTFLRPVHAARLRVVGSGRLGRVSQAHVSATHGYHGIAMLRRYLDVGSEEVTIETRQVTSPLAVVPRAMGIPGEPTAQGTVASRRVVALLWFGERLGIHDFAIDQYFSQIRSTYVHVLGERGELRDDVVRYLVDTTAMVARLDRVDAGTGDQLDGNHHVGYVMAGEWVTRNPFAPARMSDDEIASATSLVGMDRFLRTGVPVYSMAQAATDRYMDIMLERALATGKAVHAPVRY
ncbi:MAG: Gfo/Idh/MocA family oxidoreductase [Chloroflexota bacterium]